MLANHIHSALILVSIVILLLITVRVKTSGRPPCQKFLCLVFDQFILGLQILTIN